jgi:hypothetical protein
MMYIRKFIFFLSALGLLITAGVLDARAAPTVEDLIKRKGFSWRSAVTKHLRLYFEPGTLAEARIEQLKLRQEQAFERNETLLGTDSYPYSTDLFSVESRERMKELVGDRTYGVAYPTTKVACIVYSEKSDASGSHELMHLMSGNAWGTKFKPWINEGFAVYADDNWHGHRLHDLNRYFLKKKKLISLKDLIGDFKGQAHMLSYPQAARFVKFFYDRFGVEKVRQIWSDASAKGLKRVTGEDLASLESSWHRTLMQAEDRDIKYDITMYAPPLPTACIDRSTRVPMRFRITGPVLHI